MPSLAGIFYICEYLKITPGQFFDFKASNPAQISDIVEDLKHLNDEQLKLISMLIKELIRK